MPQMGFFDLSDRYASLDAKKIPLVEINAVVPWDGFRPLPEQVWRKPDGARKSRAGRKPRDVVLNRPDFTRAQNSWRVVRYGTEAKEDLEAVVPRVPRTRGGAAGGTLVMSIDAKLRC